MIRKLGRPLKAINSSSGQALLVVLLTMSVVLTVALSVISRSTVDIATTTYEKDSLRAFSAAEAGVETALVQETSTAEPVEIVVGDSYVTYESEVTTPNAGNNFGYPVAILSGESATFWFVSHDGSWLSCTSGSCARASTVNFCWGDSSDISASTPAMEISFYYDSDPSSIEAVGSPNNFRDINVARLTYDPVTNPLIRESNFSAATVGCSWNGSYSFSSGPIDLASIVGGQCTSTAGCVVLAKVRMFYGGSSRHHVGLSLEAGDEPTLPPQGIQINSTGVAGETTRRVNVYQGFPEVFLDISVFSVNDLTK